MKNPSVEIEASRRSACDIRGLPYPLCSVLAVKAAFSEIGNEGCRGDPICHGSGEVRCASNAGPLAGFLFQLVGGEAPSIAKVT